ncbi:MAG: CRISPR-associated endonuclease Cas1 [Acidimicrobiales bacterium]
MRLTNVLYVTEYRAKIGVSRGSIIVRGGRDTTKVPIEALEAVVLFGGQISSEALTLCVAKGVRVSALRKSGRVRFTVGGPTNGNVLLRVAQARAAGDRCQSAGIARNIVAAKLESYRRLLLRWAWDASPGDRAQLRASAETIGNRVHNLVGTTSGDHIRGIEGDGTRLYFSGLRAVLASIGDPAILFPIRSRRPPRDPANALMSFLYGLALTETTGALDAIGLDPQIGFLHELRPGRPSLGLDLLEELRPVQDRLAVRLLRRREIRVEHFVTMANGAWYLSDDGRLRVLEAHERFQNENLNHMLLDRRIDRWTLPTLQATLLARHLRGDLGEYPSFVQVG